MSSYRDNPSNLIAAGDSVSTMVTKLQARLIAGLRHIGADPAETPSPSSELEFTDLDPSELFTNLQIPSGFTNTSVVANTDPRALVAANFGTGAFTSAKFGSGIIAQRGMALRNEQGHIRGLQTHRARILVLRGQETIALNVGVSSNTGSVDWTTADADEASTGFTVSSTPSVAANVRILLPAHVGKFTTAPGALEAVVSAKWTPASLATTGFTIEIYQQERTGAGAWPVQNNHNANLSYNVPWIALVTVTN